MPNEPMSEHTAEKDAGRMLNPQYEWQEWYHRLFRMKPRHNCRAWLPNAARVDAGAVMRCPICGTDHVRFNYHDDDGYDGTAEFMGWTRAGSAGVDEGELWTT